MNKKATCSSFKELSSKKRTNKEIQNFSNGKKRSQNKQKKLTIKKQTMVQYHLVLF